jgi:hypothetical protein
LALNGYHHLYTNLPPYDYPDLYLSSGEGVVVLRTARAAFSLYPAVIGSVALAGGWGDSRGNA